MLRKKKEAKKTKVKQKKVFTFSAAVFTIVAVSFATYNLVYAGKIFPGVYVAGVNLGGVKTGDGVRMLSEKISPPQKISVAYEDSLFEIDTRAVDFVYDFPQTIKAAYTLDRTGNILLDFRQRLAALFRHKSLGLRFKINEQRLEEELISIAEQVEVKPVEPSVELVKGKVVVEKGSPGILADIKKLRVEIGQSLAFAEDEPIELPITRIDPTINTSQISDLEKRATSLLGKRLVLESEENNFVYEESDLISLLSAHGEYNEQKINSIVSGIADSLNRKPQNSIFVFEERKVKEFAPAKDGIKVDEDSLKNKIVGNLRTLETGQNPSISIVVPVDKTSPKVKTEDVNDLGIKELIGKGTSRFAGSIPSRAYNINLAASNFNGALVAPGEIFSFNGTLGDISVYTGYKQAYIIKDGKTVLGDGGGVCQVSTTLFRALLNSGLPIVERRAHSYRVSYYEQDSPPGLDATVYAPTTDLKFKNDTPGHLLIQTRIDPKTSTLVFEIYGTNDGRKAKISKPVITEVTAPPEDLYQDDPTLPTGTVKQTDFKAWGAKVNFNYEVTRGEEVLFSKTFYSNFRPWQAVFLRGTGPVN